MMSPLWTFVGAALLAPSCRGFVVPSTAVRSIGQCPGFSQATHAPPAAMSAVTEARPEIEEKIVNIRPKAMDHLAQLREGQGGRDIVLRMGVRAGGCSGLSYIMDLVSESEVSEDDMVEEYDGFKCVIDPKSVLYLYGLELDYSDALIGGGFQFQNPNAESSCGCGKSFGV